MAVLTAANGEPHVGARRRARADAGEVERGATVRLALLSQDTAEIPGDLRVLEALEAVRGRATLSDGREITAGLLADRFGFRGARARTLVRDLSGGERRRLQLMRLLMGEPNVLLLDEPTNDLDIDTLTALEDLLDGWPGHARRGEPRPLLRRARLRRRLRAHGRRRDPPPPGGIEQYVELRARRPRRPGAAPPAPRARRAAPAGAVLRAARKEVARLERELEKLADARAGAARGDGGERDRPRAAARAAGGAHARCSASASGSRPTGSPHPSCWRRCHLH